MEEEPQDALCDVNVRMRKEPNGQWVYGNTSCDPGDEYGWVHIDILAEGDFRFEGAGCQVDADPPEFYPDCYKLPSFPEDDGIEVKCVMCTEDAPLPIELKEW